MYRNIKSHSVVGQLTLQIQTNKLIEKEVRYMVNIVRGCGGKEELDEGGQKLQTSSYKINKY